jgi:steroid delta-isomerase-like uncharacterized protein
MAIATDASVLEANKTLVRRAIGYNHGVADEGAQIFAPDFVAYMPGQPPMDRATFERYVATVGEGMPGYTYEIHDQIARDDMVANRLTWRGVHSGELAGIPPTGRTVELRGINMFRVRDGRVVAQWAQLDMLGMLQQIGAIPK